jgi:hypothetical protein
MQTTLLQQQQQSATTASGSEHTQLTLTAAIAAVVKASASSIHSQLPTPTILRNKCLPASSSAQNNRPIDTAGWLASTLGFAVNFHPNFKTRNYFLLRVLFVVFAVLTEVAVLAVSCWFLAWINIRP